METVYVILTDDHQLVRSGLRQLLLETGKITVVAEAADGQALLELLPGCTVDVLVLDLSMPGLSGIELLKRLQACYPQLPVLVLSMHTDPDMVARVLRAGAAGYLTKNCSPAVLVEAICKIADHGHYLDPDLVNAVVFRYGSKSETEVVEGQLSPRELQVLESIATGLSLRQIAQGLHLSPKTVSTHKMHLMKKLDLRTNVDLLKYAVRHGMTLN